MAPSQTTTSPRRLQKAKLRVDQKTIARLSDAKATAIVGQRFDFWIKLVQRDLPDYSEAKQIERAMELASMNRRERRANKMP